MNIITDRAGLARALDPPADPRLGRLLCLRAEQLLVSGDAGADLGDLVQFIVVEPADTIPAIEQAAGYPVITRPAFEWVQDHGGLIEAVTILSDDGFCVVLLVPVAERIDRSLLSVLRSHAATLTAEAAGSPQGKRPPAP